MLAVMRVRPIAERYWEKVDRCGDDECWVWKGSLSKGYGSFFLKKVKGRPIRTPAHRMGYELQVGPIPEGMTIDHLCRNRACQNARHLEPVSNRTNLLRGQGWSGRHAQATHCPKGHPYDEENTVIRTNGHIRRNCRKCRNEATAKRLDAAYWREYRRKRREQGRVVGSKN